MLDTAHLLLPTSFPAISRGRLQVLQVNLGYLCNQTCQHCHVNAGPSRTELMERSSLDQVLAFLDSQSISTLDLTGGAPELNPNFRYFVEQATRRNINVIDRCNLSVLEEPGQEDLAEFFAEMGVDVVASLPCYLQENVDNQRGRGAYDASMHGLKRLNKMGYGQDESGLLLNLVYNPQGPSLPPAQCGLEANYKRRLWDDHQIYFNQLLTITNMPISRFGSMLLSQGEFDGYIELLKTSFSDTNLQTVMCRNLLSVDWQGYLYDCDFNQMLNLPLADDRCQRPHISDLIGEDLSGRPICIAEHCYGCTAGQGSSCGGALSE